MLNYTANILEYQNIFLIFAAIEDNSYNITS